MQPGTAQPSLSFNLGMLSLGSLLANPPSRFVGMVPYGMWASDSPNRWAQHRCHLPAEAGNLSTRSPALVQPLCIEWRW